MTEKDTLKAALIVKIENYINDFVTLHDPQYSLPIALWIVGTFVFPLFDAFPYLLITASTKRSGKTRLSEMIGFACSNPRNFAAMTGPTLFRSIEDESPTIIFDEAEQLSSEAAGTMRSVLNVGYRKGQTIPRTTANGIKEYPTYCPKVFVLIGKTFDTLKDRSIVINMKRAETRRRFTFDIAKEEGGVIREMIAAATKHEQSAISDAFLSHPGLPFLMDRDEEIWTSLFVLCSIFCPGRITELQAAAADMSADKTVEGAAYTSTKESEEAANKAEYAEKALVDLFSVFIADGPVIRTEDAVNAMRAIPTSPWRRYKGDGLNAIMLADLLDVFHVRPMRIAIPRKGAGKKNQEYFRGYKRSQVEAAMRLL